MSVEIDLGGRNAFVTGGADGIGKGCAEMLAEAGANVFIADINADGAEKTAYMLADVYGIRTGWTGCDVSKKSDVDRAVDTCAELFDGRIDICQHIAGFSRAVPFMELDETMYDRVFDINVKGTYLVDQAVLRYMIPLRRGKIVNMSSMSGKIAYPTNVAYSASKFAVIGLTQGIAKSVAEYNINVNAVCPGIVYTQIWEKMLADMAARGIDADEYWEKRISAIPMGRPQTIKDVARMFLFLSSEFADNMTGQGINVTGGLITN